VKLTNSLDLKVARSVPEDGTGGERDSLGEGTGGRPGLQADTLSAKDEQLDKLTGVVIWTLTSSYNPKAPRNQGWSTVNSNVNLNIFGTSISMNQTFEPYERKLLSTSISTGLTLKGGHSFGKTESIESGELNVVAAADTSRRGGETVDGEPGPASRTERRREAKGEVIGPRDGARGPGKKEFLPWSLDLRMSYNSWSNRDPQATINMSGDIDLTPAWRISYRTSYDVEAREFRGQEYSITRDLHCWEMSFSRRLLGDEWLYYFKINLRAHPEIYAENGRRGLGGFSTRSLTSGSIFR
jgi:hypothetical protein